MDIPIFNLRNSNKVLPLSVDLGREIKAHASESPGCSDDSYPDSPCSEADCSGSHDCYDSADYSSNDSSDDSSPSSGDSETIITISRHRRRSVIRHASERDHIHPPPSNDSIEVHQDRPIESPALSNDLLLGESLFNILTKEFAEGPPISNHQEESLSCNESVQTSLPGLTQTVQQLKSKQESLGKLLQELQCPICLQVFTTTSRRPHIIHGGHTLCLECLSTLLHPSSRTSFKCPICRFLVPIPNDKTFPINFVVHNFAEILTKQVPTTESKQTNPDILCQTCEIGEELCAKSYCEQCQQWLCALHSTAHARAKKTKPHTLHDREAIAQNPFPLKPISVDVCTTHDLLTHWYCRACHIRGCAECVLMNHQGHVIIKYTDMIRECQYQCSQDLKALHKEGARLDQRMATLEIEISNIDKEYDSQLKSFLAEMEFCISEIRRLVRYHGREFLQTKRETLAKQLQESSDNRDQKRELGQIIQKIEAFIDNPAEFADVDQWCHSIQTRVKPLINTEPLGLLRELKEEEVKKVVLSKSILDKLIRDDGFKKCAAMLGLIRASYTFERGDVFIVRDTASTPLPAEIKDISLGNKEIFVHYLNWEARWDEWIPFNSSRIIRKRDDLNQNERR